jgi:hypothetical protein
VLLVESGLPGAWLIASYAAHGGQIENNLLPSSSVDGLLRAMALGLAISTVVELRRYWRLLFPSQALSPRCLPDAGASTSAAGRAWRWR